jgi:hypothetical protein
VRDPLLWKVLDIMRRYFQNQVGESVALLGKADARTEKGK